MEFKFKAKRRVAILKNKKDLRKWKQDVDMLLKLHGLSHLLTLYYNLLYISTTQINTQSNIAPTQSSIFTTTAAEEEGKKKKKKKRPTLVVKIEKI